MEMVRTRKSSGEPQMASLLMGAELPCCSWFTDAITPSYGLGANEPKLDGPNILPGRHAIYKVGNLSVSRKVQIIIKKIHRQIWQERPKRQCAEDRPFASITRQQNQKYSHRIGDSTRQQCDMGRVMYIMNMVSTFHFDVSHSGGGVNGES
jgi:hypothetical protein